MINTMSEKVKQLKLFHGNYFETIICLTVFHALFTDNNSFYQYCDC